MAGRLGAWEGVPQLFMTKVRKDWVASEAGGYQWAQRQGMEAGRGGVVEGR